MVVYHKIKKMSCWLGEKHESIIVAYSVRNELSILLYLLHYPVLVPHPTISQAFGPYKAFQNTNARNTLDISDCSESEGTYGSRPFRAYRGFDIVSSDAAADPGSFNSGW